MPWRATRLRSDLAMDDEDLKTGRIGAAISAYQASASVGAVVAGVLRLLPEVLVVDDGSTDGTAAAARQAGAHVVSLPANQGTGAALSAAFRDLFGRGFTAVVTLDADGQHLPEEIPKLLAAAAGADLVLGVRDHLFTQMSGLRRARHPPPGSTPGGWSPRSASPSPASRPRARSWCGRRAAASASSRCRCASASPTGAPPATIVRWWTACASPAP